MACGARSGLKPEHRDRGKVEHFTRLNGLWSPFKGCN